MSSYQYRKSHYGDKTILRPSYLHNGISCTGETTSLYWIRAMVPSYLAGSIGVCPEDNPQCGHWQRRCHHDNLRVWVPTGRAAMRSRLHAWRRSFDWCSEVCHRPKHSCCVAANCPGSFGNHGMALTSLGISTEVCLAKYDLPPRKEELFSSQRGCAVYTVYNLNQI